MSMSRHPGIQYLLRDIKISSVINVCRKEEQKREKNTVAVLNMVLISVILDGFVLKYEINKMSEKKSLNISKIQNSR